MRQELLTWDDVDKLMDVLLPQLKGPFDALLMITRGGIVPGGMISEALDIKVVLTAAVDFPLDLAPAKLLAWPEFLQFPDERLLAGRRVLLVDDVWGSGRTITAVKNRVEAAGGFPELCVLHYNPTRTLFTKAWPTYYAAITDARIVYPWEIDRSGGLEGVMAAPPETN
jgi:hypoxanthine phosphoribosyltransferase